MLSILAQKKCSVKSMMLKIKKIVHKLCSCVIMTINRRCPYILNNLKLLREGKGISQNVLIEELEKAPYNLKISRRTLQYWESNKRDIKTDKAEKLADYFGVPVSYLLGYSDDFFNKETSKINNSLNKGIELVDGTSMNKEEFRDTVLTTEDDEALIDFGKTRLVSMIGPTPSDYWDNLGDDFFRMVAVAPSDYVSLVFIWSLMTKEQQISILKMLKAFDFEKKED